jgi:ketosteroid isomerase-like protein
MDIFDEDIAELTALLDQGRDAWINGRPQWEDPESLMSQADDATIFGPFGGVAPAGQAPRVRPDTQRQIAGRFRGGSGSTEVLRTIVEGDLVIVLYVDRSTVTFDDGDAGPWTLRVTEMFRREPQRWVRLHRHADPLIRFRDLAATRELMG